MTKIQDVKLQNVHYLRENYTPMGTQGMGVGKRGMSKRCCAKTITAPDLVVSVMERLNQTNLILACLMRAPERMEKYWHESIHSSPFSD